MVRLCFALLLLHKEQDGIHMPRRLMDDLEDCVADENFGDCVLGNDILILFNYPHTLHPLFSLFPIGEKGIKARIKIL